VQHVLRQVDATLYVTPLREGGSLPGIVEADDLGTYVAKFVGAGQGRKALIAEVITGELARRLGLRVPEMVSLEIDPSMASNEPDEEVQDLLRASGGTNLGVDYLPGSLGYDPIAHRVDADFAERVVWLDSFVGNVDRSWRNPNLLVWHRDVWLIDHGATLIFHHDWAHADAAVTRAGDLSDHVLASYVEDVRRVHESMAEQINESWLHEIVGLVPEGWLVDEPGFDSAQAVRDSYVDVLWRRLDGASAWLPAPDAFRRGAA
jgi:hypothetical protein